MNENFNTKKIPNQYDGNGWSKYQLMVLQQLDDHNKLLQNFNKEINDIKQTNAISETELKMWRAQIMKSLEKIDEKMDFIFYEENGVTKRLNVVENIINVEEKSQTKIKAVWTLYAAILMFLANVALQIWEIVLRS
jgi:hypothetical protein